MSQSLEIAKQFFEAFKLSDAVWTFQTFDDSEAKRKNLISVRAGSIATHYPDLEKINREGAGIFVTINLQTDPKKRSKANTDRVAALFVDFDGAPLPETWRLEPSLIVESSLARYHAYWICSDIPLKEFEALQKALAALYGGDPVCHDLPRVMRVPGFLHQKAEPFLSTIIHAPAHQYSRAEMLEAYPELVEAIKPKIEKLYQWGDSKSRQMHEIRSTRNGDTRRYAVAALDAEIMAVEQAKMGDGNAQINRSAFALGQLVAGGELEESEVIRCLENAVRSWAKPDPKASDTIRSGLSAGKLQPRTAPPSEFTTSGHAKIRHDPNTPVPAGATKKKPNARGMGFTDYRDAYLDHLAETGTRIAHLEKNNSWWVYSGGVYKQILEATMRRWVDTALAEYDLGENILATVLSKLARVDSIHKAADQLASHELNTANGILNLHTLELTEHTPEFFSTVQTAANWNPEARAPKWQEFLEFAVPRPKDRWVIQQYFGYALTGSTKYETALFLVGEGRTGKGTIARTASALLGGYTDSSYATGVSFEALEDGGHLMPVLVGKRLAVISEIARNIDWLSFKRITGEDVVLINEKHKSAYPTRLTCKLIMLANSMPNLKEDATNSSILRRLIMIEMNSRPEEPDTGLEQKLIAPAELSGILRWSVAGLHSLENGNGFHDPEGDLPRRIMEQSNRVITWLDECCNFDCNAKKYSKDLYENYREWCHNTNHREVSSSKFKEYLLSACKTLKWNVEFTRISAGSVFQGIAFRTGLGL